MWFGLLYQDKDGENHFAIRQNEQELIWKLKSDRFLIALCDIVPGSTYQIVKRTLRRIAREKNIKIEELEVDPD